MRPSGGGMADQGGGAMTGREIEGRLAAQKEGPRERCLAGLHAMTPENVYVHPQRGKRSCKACQIRRGREWRQRRGETR